MEEQKLPPIKGAKAHNAAADRRAKFRERAKPEGSSHEHQPRSHLKANTFEWSSAGSSQVFDWKPKEVITFDQMVKQVNEEHEVEQEIAAGRKTSATGSPEGLDKLALSVEEALDPWIESGRVTPSDIQEVVAGLVAKVMVSKKVLRTNTLSPNMKHRLPREGAPRATVSTPLRPTGSGGSEAPGEEEDDGVTFTVEASKKQGSTKRKGAAWKTASKAEKENIMFAKQENKGREIRPTSDAAILDEDDGDDDFDDEQDGDEAWGIFSSTKASDKNTGSRGRKGSQNKSMQKHRGSIDENDSDFDDEDEFDMVEDDMFDEYDGDEATGGGVGRRRRRRRRRRKKKASKKQPERRIEGPVDKIRVSLVMQQKSAGGSREWITNLKIPAQMKASDFRVGVLEVLRDRGDIPVCVKIRKEGGFLNGDQEKVYKIADCTLQRKRAGRKVVGIKGLPSVCREDFLSPSYTRVWDSYEKGKNLGSGAFGTVVIGVSRDTSRQEHAIKIIPKSKVRNIKALEREIAIMKRLDHESIIKLHSAFEDEKNVFLAMDLCKGGELYDRICKMEYLSEKEASFYVKQILEALEYCHGEGIVHRDLKPENFMLKSKGNNADLRIIDFGLSRFYKRGKKMRNACGTILYVAPEVLRESYDEKCDLWSLGCIVFVMLFGYPPFDGESEAEVMDQLLRDEPFKIEDSDGIVISEEAKDFILKLIERNPRKRMSATQALKHPWISRVREDGETPVKDPTDDNEKAKACAIQALHRLKVLNASNKLQLHTRRVIVDFLDVEETAALNSAFKRISQGKAYITQDNLQNALRTLGGSSGAFVRAADSIAVLMKQLDLDGSGRIEYEEFAGATMESAIWKDTENLRQAFNHFDTDGNGSISASELSAVLGEKESERLIRDCDLNKNGELDFEEFKFAVERKIERNEASLQSVILGGVTEVASAIAKFTGLR